MNTQRIRQITKKVLLVILVLFAVNGLYHGYYSWYKTSVKEKVQRLDAGHKDYDKDFLFNKKYGEPFIRVKPAYKETVYIIGGFRASHFYEYFEKLHKEEKVNVIAPVVGLSGWPVEQRTREWFFQEDMREHIQLYEAYISRLPKNHRIVTMSMSFGALSHAAIGVRATRKPDAMIFLSPLNTGLDYRSASPVVAWLSSKIQYLRHVIPIVIRSQNPARAGMWDIVNDRKNHEAWERYGQKVINWEENLDQGVEVRRAGRYLVNNLAKRLKGRKIIILHGDDDLVFSQKGFQGLTASFEKSGNTVQRIALEKTGHMILNDNGGDRAKNIIADVIKGNYKWPAAAKKDIGML